MNKKGGAIINFIIILLITALIFLGVMYFVKGEIPFGISGPQVQTEEVAEESVEPTSEEDMEEPVEAIDEDLESTAEEVVPDEEAEESEIPEETEGEGQ